MPYTYILECSDGSYYTGWAQDKDQRLATHNAGKGAKYTRARLPVVMVWWHYNEDKIAAQKLEAKIKTLARSQKAALIAGDTEAMAKIVAIEG